MLLCAQYVLPVTSDPIVGGAVLVRDGRIRDIGKTEMLRLRYPDEEVFDYGTAAIMPGLVDLHTHMENSIMRGIVHDVPYITWLASVAALSAKMEVSDWYDSAILGGLDALASGITCVADITTTGAACTAAQKLGLRGVVYREVGVMDKRRIDYAMRAAENDIIVIEGAGSPAEINLKADDIVNMGLAKLVDAPVLLAGDIDRGGVFAQLYGTVELLEADERARIRGLIINKFRGDVEILRPGLAMLEEKTQLPVLGVIPYLKVDIEDEDSLSTRLEAGRTVKPLDAAILRLPHISNFTDFMPLEQHPLLGVRYVQSPRQLGTPDVVILPGTKNTIDDLLWLRQCGLEAAVLKLAAQGTPVLGVCGGYQMLGHTLADPDGEESGTPCTLRGLALLPTDTVFNAEKQLSQTHATAEAIPFAGAKLTGYEIHAGRTTVQGSPFCILADGTPEGCVQANVFGTYLHGLFDTGELTEKLTAFLCKKKGISPADAPLLSMEQYRQQQLDLLADGVRAALDMDAVYAAMGMDRKGGNRV